MNRVRATLWMMAVTVAAWGVLVGIPCILAGRDPLEKEAQVRVCRVEKGNIEQVTTLAGVMRYQDEYAVVVPVTGVVSQVYVQSGERVEKGQALFRMDDSVQTAAMSAALQREASGQALPEDMGVDLSGIMQAAAWERGQNVETAAYTLENLTVRAGADGLVQQVYVTACNGAAAGSPGAVLSSETQEIQCKAVAKDAQLLLPGMQARILYDDEVAAMARVTRIGTVESSGGQSVCSVYLQPETPVDLPLGTAVSVEVIRARAQDVAVLPVEAVHDGKCVRWISQGRCYETEVTVFAADAMQCWVNLPEGTEVVLSGDAVHGQRVREVGE